MLPHPLTNFEIQKYQNEPKLKEEVYWRKKLFKIKDGVYLIDFDEHKSIGNHWIALYVNGNNKTYFDKFGAEYILKETKRFMTNKNTTTSIYRISVMCKYFFI